MVQSVSGTSLVLSKPLFQPRAAATPLTIDPRTVAIKLSTESVVIVGFQNYMKFHTPI